MRRVSSLYRLAMILFAVAPAMAQGQGLQTIRVISVPGPPLPLVVATMQGMFAKHGVQVHNEVAPSSDRLRSALAAGEADIAHIAVDNAVALAEAGGVDVVIVMGGETTLNELIAQPGIHTISDLRGQTIIVDAVNTAYALQLKKMLLSSGLEAGRDYRMNPIGASPLRIKGLRENKEYAASMLGPPFSIVAKKEGFVSLGWAENFVGRSQSSSAFALRQWAHDHADTLVSYLAAYVEAQRWLLAPANKQRVIELIAKESGVPAPVAAEMYAGSMQGHGGYQKDARLDVDAFKNVLKLRAEVEGQWGGKAPAPEKYYDPSFYRRAVSQLK